MFGLIASACFLVALIVNIAVKGTDAKYALDFAYAGAMFLSLHLAWPVYPWRRGGPA
jgi:hypothetical protein